MAFDEYVRTLHSKQLVTAIAPLIRKYATQTNVWCQRHSLLSFCGDLWVVHGNGGILEEILQQRKISGKFKG